MEQDERQTPIEIETEAEVKVSRHENVFMNKGSEYPYKNASCKSQSGSCIFAGQMTFLNIIKGKFTSVKFFLKQLFSLWRAGIRLFFDVVAGNIISHQLRERIALLISGANHAKLSALLHSCVGSYFGLQKKEIRMLIDVFADEAIYGNTPDHMEAISIVPPEDRTAVLFFVSILSRKNQKGIFTERAAMEKKMREEYGEMEFNAMMRFARFVQLENTVLKRIEKFILPVLSFFINNPFSTLYP